MGGAERGGAMIRIIFAAVTLFAASDAYAARAMTPEVAAADETICQKAVERGTQFGVLSDDALVDELCWLDKMVLIARVDPNPPRPINCEKLREIYLAEATKRGIAARADGCTKLP
jgi:hypothetical protein